jgi:pimeloyl-ACP methyl ester carboxylesterase
MQAAWARAVGTAAVDRPATALPPVVFERPGGARTVVLVVCSPWRYCHEQFARDVRGWAPRDVTLVVLSPPFAHPDGGYEWWGYAPRRRDGSAMERWELGCACGDELRASVRIVRDFVAALGSRVVLMGSSQGGTLAVHVAMAGPPPPNLVRVFAHQPAGLYPGEEWEQGKGLMKVVVERCHGYGHGDLAQWRGRLGRGVRRVILSLSTADRVAPARLVESLL